MTTDCDLLVVMGGIRWRIRLHLLLATLSLAPLSCSNPAPPALTSTPTVEWTATEELRIGSVDDSATALTSVGSLAVDSAGRIYVAQPVEKTIRVFDAAGHRVGTIGRPGDGPGEFRNVQFPIGILEDTLYVPDMQARHVTFFSLDGKLLGTLQLAPYGLVGKEWHPITPWWLAPDGTALSLPDYLTTMTYFDVHDNLLLVRIDRSGEIVDTAALAIRPPETLITLRLPFGPANFDAPFSGPSMPFTSADGSRVAVVHDDGVTRGNGATFQVTVLHSTRDTLWSHSYAYEPIPISPSIVDSTVTELAGSLRDVWPDPAVAEREIRHAMSLPDHMPPVSGGVFADDGSLWMRRERGQSWTVLDSTGAPVARIALPPGLRVDGIRSNKLWGVETDSLGVPYVVRYVITR